MATVVGERSVLRDLSGARRSHFIEHNDFLTVIVKGYFAVIVAGIVVDVASNSSKFFTFSASELASLSRNGANYAGAMVALALFMGLMAGTRGGPVALFRAELRMLFLSPLNRERLIRKKAIRALEHFGFIGIAGGVAVGIAAHSLLKSNALEVPVYLGAYGLVVALAYGSGATLALGLRVKKPIGYLVGLAVMGWEAFSIFKGIKYDPFALSGSIALSPLSHGNSGWIALPIWLLICAVGIVISARGDLERIERHSELVSRLRFALSARDVRSVIVLSRALSEDGYRARQGLGGLWSALASPSSAPLLRSASNLAHWSPRRYLRLVLLSSAGVWFAAQGWVGAKAIYLLAVPAVFAAGLELADSVSSVVEKPDLFVNYPVDDGWLLTRLLVLPATISVALALGEAAVVHLLVPGIPLLVLEGIALAMGAGAVFGAAVASVRSGAPPGIVGLLTPETQAFGFFIELIPVAIASAWLIPAINSRSAALANRPPEPDALSAAFFALILPLAAWAWLRGHKVLKAD